MLNSEKKKIFILYFKKNLLLLKKIFLKTREDFIRQINNKTLIYRGAHKKFLKLY